MKGSSTPFKRIRTEDPSSSPWKIKKTLTEEELNTKAQCIRLDNSDVKNFILKHWSDMKIKRAEIDDIQILIDDLDTGDEHKSNFRCYKHGLEGRRYFLQGLWKYNFVERRSLAAGDEIGMFYDPRTDRLCFSVLKRAKSDNVQS